MKIQKILAVILSCVMLLCALPMAVFAGDKTVIIAASDFQHPKGNDAGKKTVDAIIGAMKNDGITSADGFLFCGDYDHDLTMLPGPTASGLKTVKACADELVDPNGHHVFLQGNHDSVKQSAGLSPSGNNDPESGKYGVFAINEDDYSWFNISREVVQGTADNLRIYLNEKLEQNFKAPIFVMSHLPLHYSCRSKNAGDGRYGEYIFDVLNEAGAKGLNIIYLFGHDHSNGWDDYLGGAAICLEKGDSINTCKKGNQFKFNTHTLNFTYLNAGYTGYYDDHNGIDDALTMTVYEIMDDAVVISRYDTQGKHNLKSAGVTNKHKNEKGYAPNTEIKESGLRVELGDVTDSTPIEGGINLFTKIVMYLYNLIETTLRAISI